MEINGREVKFCRTVYANCKIADICENGDIKNVGKLFDGGYRHSQTSAAKFIAFLNEGYEQKMKFAEPGYKPNPLSEEEVLSLDEIDFAQIFDEAVEAWTGEKPTIETAPVPGKKTKKTRAKST